MLGSQCWYGSWVHFWTQVKAIEWRTSGPILQKSYSKQGMGLLLGRATYLLRAAYLLLSFWNQIWCKWVCVWCLKYGSWTKDSWYAQARAVGLLCKLWGGASLSNSPPHPWGSSLRHLFCPHWALDLTSTLILSIGTGQNWPHSGTTRTHRPIRRWRNQAKQQSAWANTTNMPPVQN